MRHKLILRNWTVTLIRQRSKNRLNSFIYYRVLWSVLALLEHTAHTRPKAINLNELMIQLMIELHWAWQNGIYADKYRLSFSFLLNCLVTKNEMKKSFVSKKYAIQMNRYYIINEVYAFVIIAINVVVVVFSAFHSQQYAAKAFLARSK